MKASKHKDVLGDRLKYLRGQQLPKHKRPLEKRSPKVLPPALLKYMKTARQAKKVRLQTSARGKGSKDSYNRIFLDIEKFLRLEEKSLTDLNEDLVLEFLDELDDNKRAFCYVKTVKPAVLFLELALDLKGLWTKPLQRAFEGVVARAAVEKPPVQKGHCLPLEILEKILHHFITPHVDPQNVSNSFI